MMIVTEELSKEYSGKTVVAQLSIHVEPGETYGFLGPNGSGKSTTIRMILGLVQPTSGRLLLFGQEMNRSTYHLRKRIGVVGEQQCLYDHMTTYAYLKLFSELYGIERSKNRIDFLLEQYGLTEYKNYRVGELSHGMRQKLSIIRALLNDPDLIIMDEPVTGLDPKGIKEVRDLIHSENKRGKTIFLSSHVLSEVEATAHRVGILCHGKLIAESDLDHFRNSISAPILEVEVDQATKQLSLALQAHAYVSRVQQDNNTYELTLSVNHDIRKEISEIIASHGNLVLGMKQRQTSLEDAFLSITEDKLREFVGFNHG